MKEEILSIASDLRKGSMTTNEAKEHLLRLFGVIGSLPCHHNYIQKDTWWKSCTHCGMIAPLGQCCLTGWRYGFVSLPHRINPQLNFQRLINYTACYRQLKILFERWQNQKK